MKRQQPATLDLKPEDLRACMARVQEVVAPEDFAVLAALLEAYLYVRQALSAARVSVARLKRLFFGSTSEKASDILPRESQKGSEEGNQSSGKPDDRNEQKKEKKKRKGHGRNGVGRYPGAQRIEVLLKGFYKGAACPIDGCDGKVYVQDSRKILRIIGQPALKAIIWEQGTWRCSLCDTLFYAELPPEAKQPKYDATAVAMIAILHFGNGLPYHRLACHQKDLGIPLPASVQSELLNKAQAELTPVFNQLKKVAAQGEIVHSDDTRNRILSLNKQQGTPEVTDGAAKSKKGKRTGIFTTGIVSITDTHTIALYHTGTKHAGENLDDILQLREEVLGPPIHMSDGLDHNRPANAKTIEGKCLTHGRRKFVDVISGFPGECQRVIEDIREVYRVDAIAKEKDLSDQERLFLHLEKSAPIMDRLHRWLVDLLLEKSVEPNSSLGKAIKYVLKRWKPLTLFLRQPGAPLDNNIAERILKVTIRVRKNSLFFKTEAGAAVGDLFLSLIGTCQLNKMNPFDYLVALLSHLFQVKEDPASWMPWNYRETLKNTTSTTSGERVSTQEDNPASTDDPPKMRAPPGSGPINLSSDPASAGVHPARPAGGYIPVAPRPAP